MSSFLPCTPLRTSPVFTYWKSSVRAASASIQRETRSIVWSAAGWEVSSIADSSVTLSPSKLFRRCGCRNDDAKTYPTLPDQPTTEQVDRACPQMSDPKHGRWSFRLSAGFDPVTKRRRQINGGTYPTKREAQQERNKLAVKLDQGKVPTARRETMADYLPRWLERAGATGTSRRRKPLAATTLENYWRYAEQDVMPTALAGMQLRDVRRRHVQAFVDDLAKERGAVTVRRIVAVVQGALSSAVRDELIEDNPARDLDLPHAEPKRFEPWTPEQVGHFLDVATSHRMGALLEVAVLTGLRRSELVALAWADVDLAGRELAVRRSKTDAGVRRVPLGDAVVGALVAWQIAQADERAAWGPAYVDGGLVFTMEDGRPLKLQYATRLFDHLREQAELPAMTLHGLRHMAASLHLAAGSEVEFVSKLLGHSDVRVTSGIYSHLLRGAGHDNADRAAALVPRAGSRTVHTHGPQNADEAAPVFSGNGL